MNKIRNSRQKTNSRRSGSINFLKLNRTDRGSKHSEAPKTRGPGRTNPQVLTLVALSVVINFVGAQCALVLRLPIYLDSIGTILAAILLGPVFGALTGGLTAIINGVTFDPVSLYFLPVYLFTGLATGLLFKGRRFQGIRSVAGIALIGVLVSIISSIIVALVFGGVTSSGSSLVVAFLKNIGVNPVVAIFATQVVTDVTDKFLAFSAAFAIIRAIPGTYRMKLQTVSRDAGK